MENQESNYCSIHDVPILFGKVDQIPSEPLSMKLRIAVRRRLNIEQIQKFKNGLNRVLDFFQKLKGEKRSSVALVDNPPVSALKSGDLVRVRSEAEINATLDHWGRLKGCTFIEGMSPYCGTTQRVFKSMERFVDERNYQVKKTHGIVLLQGLHCEGSADYGRCDRACFYFWRVEWLEKIPEESKL